MARGSQPGERRGGRKKGAKNKASVERQKKVAESGLTPLDYMLSVLRGQHPEGSEPAVILAWEAMRFEAAKAAAPYVHPRLAAVEHSGKGGGAILVKLDDADSRA